MSKPCGGCGAESSKERCIGCLHDFEEPGNGSCLGVVGIQRIGDSVAHASARAATMAYVMSQLDLSGPTTEPPPKPTPKSNTATPSVPLRARKKELRQIEHRKRLKNRK